MRVLAGFAAALGFVSVAIGAFAAHALSSDPGAARLLERGAHYQAIHALAALAAIFVVRGGGRPRMGFAAAAAFLLGATLFPTALYALAFGAPRAVALAAPIGGLAFCAGWAMLGIAAWGPAKVRS